VSCSSMSTRSHIFACMHAHVRNPSVRSTVPRDACDGSKHAQGEHDYPRSACMNKHFHFEHRRGPHAPRPCGVRLNRVVCIHMFKENRTLHLALLWDVGCVRCVTHRM
jgi:hypothetical protein